jgi:hypothetical protein
VNFGNVYEYDVDHEVTGHLCRLGLCTTDCSQLTARVNRIVQVTAPYVSLIPYRSALDATGTLYLLRIVTFKPTTITMSPTSPTPTGQHPSHSTRMYRSIFDSALKVYEEKTGKDLTSDPLHNRLETCNSPEGILVILRQQIPGVQESQSSDDGLTRWLKPTINVIQSLSTTIGGAVGSVSPMSKM